MIELSYTYDVKIRIENNGEGTILIRDNIHSCEYDVDKIDPRLIRKIISECIEDFIYTYTII